MNVTNTGKLTGDEVVELYLTDEKASTPRPIRQLEGFTRISLKPGESKVVELKLEPRQFSMINNKSKRVIEPGYFTISVGGKQPGFKGYLDPQFTQVLTGRIQINRERSPLTVNVAIPVLGTLKKRYLYALTLRPELRDLRLFTPKL